LESKAHNSDVKEKVLTGIFVARFDQVLGAVPFHMYPHGFVTEEQAKDAALEAMLLFMFGRGERIASIMGFERLDYMGYVLVDFDSGLGNYVVLALFDSDVRKLLWEKYNTIKFLLTSVSEAVQRRVSIDDALENCYNEINSLCMKSHVAENASIERGGPMIAQPRTKTLATTVSLAIESVITEAGSQQPEAVSESIWEKIKKVVLAFIQFSRVCFGEDFTRTEILPHLLRKDQRL
jgi:hypothetical protein